MKKWIGLMAIATAASSVSAVSLYEPFNYPTGAVLDGQVAADGQPWATAGTAGGFSGTIGTGSLADSSLPPSQGNDVVWGGTSDSGTSERVDVGGYNTGTVYYSMLFQVNNIADLTSSFIAGFNNSVGTGSTPSVIGAKLFAQADASVPGDYELGILNSVSSGAVYDTTDALAPGQTVFVVASYQIVDPASPAGGSDDIANLWVNPDPSTFSTAAPPAPSATYTGGDLKNAPGYDIASFLLRQNSVAPSQMTADEIRVGTTWGGVTAVDWTASTPGTSSWTTASNWSSGAVPGAQGADVSFGAESASDNVLLTSPETVGTVRFNGSNSYTISGSSTLTFDTPTTGDLNIGTDAAPAYVASSANPAQIIVSGSASHTISAPVYLNRSTALTVPSGSTLSLTGGVSANTGTSAGVWLSLTGGGNAVITPASTNAFTGLTGLDISGNLQFTPAHSVIVLNLGTPTVGKTPTANTITYFNLAAGSTLDLTNNDLIVNRNGGDGGIETAILNAVEHARDNGAWDGTGITSSLAASTPGTSLAYVDNALLATPLTTVDNQPVTNLSVIVKYTWYGDLDLDGMVTASDLATITANFGMSNVGWAGGDLNYDGIVNADDFSLFQLGSAKSNGANISAVPEPGAALALAGIGLLAGRRRRLAGR